MSKIDIYWQESKGRGGKAEQAFIEIWRTVEDVSARRSCGAYVNPVEALRKIRRIAIEALADLND